MKTKQKYEKPTLQKAEKMVFMFDSLKCIEGKQDGNCSDKCIHKAPLGCRQCSGCHGCR
jgi:hypothetical protein